MPKSKNKRKSGSGKKGTQWNKKVMRSVEAENQKIINAERELILSLGH